MALKSLRMTLIKAMHDLLCEKNFAKITIQEICDTAYINRRTFYHYYHDKYSLLADTYEECFFSKLEIGEKDSTWDVFGKICDQIYHNKSFFIHIIDVKGQNGFWDEMTRIMSPYYRRSIPAISHAEREYEFFIRADVTIMLSMIEEWLRKGLKQSPKEFSDHARTCFSIYGLWTYQTTTNQPTHPFTENYMDEVSW